MPINKKSIGIMKKIILAIFDISLFSVSNTVCCYFVNMGKVFETPYSHIIFNYFHFFIISALIVTINYCFGLYRSIWAFAGADEIVSCTVASFFDTVALFLIDKILFKRILGYNNIMPFYAYILMFIFVIFCTCVPRIGYRTARKYIHNTRIRFTNSDGRNKKRVMIVGAGYMGNAVIDDILANQNSKYKVVVAIDDNPAKKGKRINHIKIAGNCSQIPQIADKYEVDEIIICIPSATKKRQNEILKIALETGRRVKTSPSIEEILESNDEKSKKIRNVEISDLLARDEIKLDIKVCKYLIDKTILVTGGGGSIGSELCMQCARYKPRTIIIFDVYENCAFELANELNEKYKDSINIYVRIGSVRDVDRLNEVFEEFHPDVVFHAAAHKHVPLMEDSPCEAVKNNVFGTYNVAVAADRFKVSKMVILSTDKAVNPTNVMGA
ncbi:MAG: polysaccharide biosynthesis protein, partial [Eubacterium sp.]